jgi:hypothetical protein
VYRFLPNIPVLGENGNISFIKNIMGALIYTGHLSMQVYACCFVLKQAILKVGSSTLSERVAGNDQILIFCYE